MVENLYEKIAKEVPKEVAEERKERIEAEHLVAMTETLSTLSLTVEFQNILILALLGELKQRGGELPNWKTEADVERDAKPLLDECLNLMNKIYGQRKTDKS